MSMYLKRKVIGGVSDPTHLPRVRRSSLCLSLLLPVEDPDVPVVVYVTSVPKGIDRRTQRNPIEEDLRKSTTDRETDGNTDRDQFPFNVQTTNVLYVGYELN